MANSTNKVYDYVTERIIGMLEKGNIPWRKPWSGLQPENYISGKTYRGINLFLLSCAPYSDHRYLTFKQVKSKGGNVKKGEKGHIVIFWKFIETSKTQADGTVKYGKIPFLRYFTVFNVEQTENWNPKPLPAVSENPINRIDSCESFVKGLPEAPMIEGSVDRAFYRPMTDSIGMPDIKRFVSAEKYYSTLFHELTHWTGSEKRMARFEKTEVNLFGSESYSKEELVAEMGAAFLCSEMGIDNTETTENTVAYIQSWMKRLKEDNTLLISAASKAKKAAAWMKGEKTDYSTDESGVEAEKEAEPVEAN